jgi:hypothetical protein
VLVTGYLAEFVAVVLGQMAKGVLGVGRGKKANRSTRTAGAAGGTFRPFRIPNQLPVVLLSQLSLVSLQRHTKFTPK